MDHTVKSYDRELHTLKRRVAEMGGIAEKTVVTPWTLVEEENGNLIGAARVPEQ